MALGACQATTTQQGAVIGAGGGAVVGNLVGSVVGGDNARIIGTLIGAGAGALLGGQIGSMLEERDRALAAEASERALERAEAERRIAAAEERARAAERRAANAETAARNAETAARNAETAANNAARRPAPAPAPEVRRELPAQQPETWTSDENDGVRGSATVVEAPSDNCYTVREVAFVPGQGEVAQNAQYCREGSSWRRV
jgi:surface antigen